jgi:hypothetical protein
VTISLGVCDYFIRGVFTISLGVVCYGCFNFICFVMCVCVCNTYIYCVLFVYLSYCFVVVL